MQSHPTGWAGSVWPHTLLLPVRPPKLIYLDLNHWIELSKAYSGHQDGKKNRHTLDDCLKAVTDNRLIFPLSLFTCIEISKITNSRQRRDLRGVIELVSQYMVVTSPDIVATHEIEAVLDHAVGPNPAPLTPTDYLDWGVCRAFGEEFVLRIESPGGDDVTEKLRGTYPHGPEAFDALVSEANLKLNRKVIEGPTPQEEPALRALGWRPEVGVEGFEQKASEELAQARRFDEHVKWRLGRTYDAITVREVIFEIGDIFAEGFAARGTGAAEHFFATDRVSPLSAYSAMPSLDVVVTLKASLHRNPNHRWTNNDLFDIRALGLTIPYCDVVVTDRAMWSHVTRHKLQERYDTVVIHRLADLLDHI